MKTREAFFVWLWLGGFFLYSSFLACVLYNASFGFQHRPYHSKGARNGGGRVVLCCVVLCDVLYALHLLKPGQIDSCPAGGRQAGNAQSQPRFKSNQGS